MRMSLSLSVCLSISLSVCLSVRSVVFYRVMKYCDAAYVRSVNIAVSVPVFCNDGNGESREGHDRIGLGVFAFLL
jgi:hypothetical protein